MHQGDRITFVDEIMGVVDAFLEHYECERGPVPDPLERALIASYILGVMRTNIDAVWDALVASRVFGAADPRALFAEQVARAECQDQQLKDEVREQLVARGWVSSDSS